MVYENKEKYPIYVSKKLFDKKHVDLLLIGEEGKRHYVLIKYFYTFLYDDTIHHGRKQFCCFCLQAFITEEILKHHIKDCFKVNGEQRIKMPKKCECVRFRNYERKVKSPLCQKIMENKIQMGLFKNISRICCLRLWL